MYFPAAFSCNFHKVAPAIVLECSMLKRSPLTDAQRQEYLEKARTAPNIHVALRAMREACLLDRRTLGTIIAERTGMASLAANAIADWEGNRLGYPPALPGRQRFGNYDMLGIYGDLLTERGMGDWWQANAADLRAKWQEAEVERHARTHGAQKPKSAGDISPFGKAMLAAFAACGISDRAQIGALVAGAQEYPDRANMPYHQAVVDAWVDGRLLPSAAAYAAIGDMVADKASPALRQQMEQAYDDALMQAPSKYPPTELSVTWAARQYAANLTHNVMAESLNKAGARTIQGGRFEPVNYHHYRTGKNHAPDALLEKVDALLDGKAPGPSLHSIAQLARREEAETRWRAAEEAGSLGGMMAACRYRLDMSMRQMSERLGEETGHAPGLQTVHEWEYNKTLPTRRSLPGTDLVTCYAGMMQQADAADTPDTQQAQGPWWNAQRETQMRALLEERITQRDENRAYRAKPQPRNVEPSKPRDCASRL